MAAGIREWKTRMMTWPQLEKIDRPPEQPDWFHLDGQTRIFGYAPPGLHQEWLQSGELSVRGARGVMGQGFCDGGQEIGWMGGEVGEELLETFIGAAPRLLVPAQGIDKTFQMWFLANANASTAR
eukprot:7377307-Prymnesium_polylepis.1